MKPRTLEALKGSIRKWEKIVDGTGIDRGPNNCPLCELFLNYTAGINKSKDCIGCPVMEKTEMPYCDGSPYRDWCDTADIKDAKRELKFLKSLLPKVVKVKKHTSRNRERKKA